MLSSRIIKRNKELEKYFLSYIKWVTLAEDVPENPQECSSLEEFEMNKIFIYNSNKATEDLMSKLCIEYGFSLEIDSCDDPLNQLIGEVCEYYVEKYGFEMILSKEHIEYEITPLYNLNQILEETSNKCITCNSKRIKKAFKELPTDVQSSFEDIKEETDYFLYCPKCITYAMMGKGFNLND
jgi:hypothetical protein